MTTQTLSKGAVVAGRYRIVAQLGEGGMGAVYRATQEPLGREVALKVMSAALSQDAGAIERFQREAKASSSLAHPNIVTVFDFGDDQGSLFIAMELIPGRGLDGLLEQGPMPWRRAASILRGICAALYEAHEKGIVHRDLKPANVIITSTATQSDVPKVVDFGIAKLRDSGPKNLTMTGAVVGTPGYVAPELFHGIEPSPAADLYALGVLAFDLLCGGPPFKGNTAAELLKQHLFDPPPAPSSVMAGLPLAFDALVLSLLEKDPARRPASALEVDRTLASILDGNAASVVAVTPLLPTQPTELGTLTPTPPTRNNLVIAAATPAPLPPPRPSLVLPLALIAGGVAIALIVGVVVLGVFTMRERREDKRLANREASSSAPAAASSAAPPAPVPPLVPAPVVPPPAPAVVAAPPPPPEIEVAVDEPSEKIGRRKLRKIAAAAAAAAPPVAPVVPAPPAAASTSTMRAYLGTVPDPRYEGHGVRISTVTPGSPAARAALAPMDVLLRIDSDIVDSVPGLAIAMARHHPGDRVRVTFTRAGVEHAVDLTLSEPPGLRRDR